MGHVFTFLLFFCWTASIMEPTSVVCSLFGSFVSICSSIYVILWCLLGVIRGEEERVLNQTQMGHYQPKKLENWEHQILDHTTTTNPSPPPPPNFVDIVKQEFSNTNKFLNFSSHNTNFPDLTHNQPAHHLPEVRFSCKSFEQSNHIAPVSGSACKKARIHPPSSSQPPLKVT